jgi:hypothetical protein
MNEKMKILIGYDGSDCSEAALDDLRKAGLPQSDVEALVLSVADVFMLPSPPPSSYEIVEAATEAEARAIDQRRYATNVRAMEAAEGVRPPRRGAFAEQFLRVGRANRSDQRLSGVGTGCQSRRVEARPRRRRLARAFRARAFRHGQRLAESLDGGALFSARRARAS